MKLIKTSRVGLSDKLEKNWERTANKTVTFKEKDGKQILGTTVLIG